MSAQLIAVMALVAWISFGPVLSVIMGRRGYSPAAWGTIGLLLGPLAVPLALDAVRRRRVSGLVVLDRPESRPGPVSVLAAIDGSPEAVAALTRAVSLLANRIGRLSLVTVVSYDAAEDRHLMKEEETLARTWMTAARAAAPGVQMGEYVIPGQPADALARFAADGGYDLVVIGSRGRGLSPLLFGSVATALAASAPVPVLVGGQGGTTWSRSHDAVSTGGVTAARR